MAAASFLKFGVPFPVKGYTHNVFFDFAGNLIGLVVVFSHSVPWGAVPRDVDHSPSSSVNTVVTSQPYLSFWGLDRGLLHQTPRR